MILLRFVIGTVSVGASAFGAGLVCAQNYPDKPIRIITSQPGGGNDFTARLIAQGLTGPLGQQVIVDNRAGGVLTSEVVAKALPDGYTLLVNGGTHWIGPLLRDAPYDPVRDFSPISMVDRAPLVLVVHPSLPVKSVKDLINLAKAKPGMLNYATGSTGSSNHLASELFRTMAGLNMVRVPYKGNIQAVTSVVAGESQLMFSNTPSVAPHLISRKVRALAVSSVEPSPLVPGVPTVAASGLPGFESIAVTGMFAPAKTPNAIINRLDQEIVRVLQRADVKQKFFDTGVEVVGSPPEALTAFIKSDMSALGKVIKDAGIKEK